MEDSFFGFDTSAPVDDGGGCLTEPSEEEYDALNDQTFGSAIKGDWETAHESLVRLDGVSEQSPSYLNTPTKKPPGFADLDEYGNSDLEINLSRVKIEDVELDFDDSECGINLDPRVWENTDKLLNNTAPAKPPNYLYQAQPNFLQQNLAHPFDMMQQHLQQQRMQQHHQQQLHMHQTPQLPLTNNFFGQPLGAKKICTLEDIERNIINQQLQQQQQQQQHHARQSQQPSDSPVQPRVPTPKSKTPIPTLQQQQQHQLHQALQMGSQQHHPAGNNSNGNFFSRSVCPPGFPNPRPNFNLASPHMLPNIHTSGPHRMPPGFPAMSLLPGAHGPQMMGNFPRPIGNLPIALNNFAMHPNFNAMRPIVSAHPQQRMPPHPGMLANVNSSQNNFNQRLVQEIQQNHPMLSRGFPNMYANNNGMPQSLMQHNNQNSSNRLDKKQNVQNLRANGNLPEEFDEYANLMSNRDKQWLITIQLSQLNTETPYIDDYYYTVFKERRAKQRGCLTESKAHKDNQLNHPFSQPRGHAQLVLVSMGNKNGSCNRNGQNNRERKNSESKNDKDQQRSLTLVQFENSLGKLQYGSVTAPRKLIDMEVMGTEPNVQSVIVAPAEVSSQRKSRHILLHIETLYRIVLKLEDLQNPTAIATTVIIKERKEKEQLLALDQATNENTNRTASGSSSAKSLSTANGSFANSATTDRFEIETREQLLAKLIPGLTHEKIVAMMTIRKGKALLRRIMPHIADIPERWYIWIGVFLSLQAVLKKDKDDIEGTLYTLYPEFKRHLQWANFDTILRIAYVLPLADKKLVTLFSNKFCISSLVAIIIQAENIFTAESDPTLTDATRKDWSTFLEQLSLSLNRMMETHTINAAIESDAIIPMMKHFSRFEYIKLDPLLSLCSQAGPHVK